MRVRVCILNLQSIIKVTMTSFVSLDIRFISLVNLGVIHILRNHQRGGGFRNDYASVTFVLYQMPNFITEGGGV